MKYIISTFYFLLCVPFSLANSPDDYLVFDAKINGRPIVLALDTGAENLIMFRNTAERLDLTVNDPPVDTELEPGRVRAGYTEKCRLSIADADFEADTHFFVIDLPFDSGTPPVDAVLGWSNMKDVILRIDSVNKKAQGLLKLPDDINQWSKWPIYDCPTISVLFIKVQSSAGQADIALVDTGNPRGVSLNPQRWKALQNNNKGRPYTLMAYFTPAVGLKVYEERWADDLNIGDLLLSGVPFSQMDPIFEKATPGLQAQLGLFALSRFEVIIDAPGGSFYTRKREGPHLAYQYNRAAAVFVPADPESTHLIAHVVDNGPAYQAGIRDGDILLKIDDLDVTKWQIDPKVLPLSRFWNKPAGTKLQLSLMRDDKPFKAVVELKNIFSQKTIKQSDQMSQ